MTLELSDKHARLDALRKMLAQAKGLSITVGVHDAEGGASHQSTSATVADIASFHEFGTNRIPARSFLRAWFDENKAKNLDILQKLGRAVLQGKLDVRTGLDLAGLRFVGDIQRRIKAHIAPPLNEATIARKRSSTPLIDTGQLWSSIRHRIEGP
jgi:hypothetical protein